MINKYIIIKIIIDFYLSYFNLNKMKIIIKMEERRIILDTETTGIGSGHKIIEVGCVELVGQKKTGRVFHYQLNPEREVDEGAFKVHGKTYEMLKDKPLFKDIYTEFLEFIGDSEIVAHNAPFDINFINYELGLVGVSPIANEITDTLILARKYFAGEPASLDALCKKYGIDNSFRVLHGALLDADLLADVFVIMIAEIFKKGVFDYRQKKNERVHVIKRSANFGVRKFVISDEEMQKHKDFLKSIGF